MDERTLKALKGSIEKWEKIVAGTGYDNAAENCPLCLLFKNDCVGCPVRERTGMDVCEGSPYWDYCNAIEDEDNEAILSYAEAELAFLRSLLPAEV